MAPEAACHQSGEAARQAGELQQWPARALLPSAVIAWTGAARERPGGRQSAMPAATHHPCSQGSSTQVV